MREATREILYLALGVACALKDLEHALPDLLGGSFHPLATVLAVHAVLIGALTAATYQQRPRHAPAHSERGATWGADVRDVLLVSGVFSLLGLIVRDIVQGVGDDRLALFLPMLLLGGLAAFTARVPDEATTPRRHILNIGLLLLAAAGLGTAAS